MRTAPEITQQPRERDVPCSVCRASTWNVSAVCDRHDPLQETNRRQGDGSKVGVGSLAVKRAALILAALALLACAPTAQAGWKTDRALAVAQTVWHPACGALTLAYGDPLTKAGDADAGGWAWAGNCEIGISNTRSMEFEELCAVVLHEAGHVAGLGHSPDVDSVMYAEPLTIKTVARIGGRTVTRWEGVDGRCLDRGRPYLERHGLL